MRPLSAPHTYTIQQWAKRVSRRIGSKPPKAPLNLKGNVCFKAQILEIRLEKIGRWQVNLPSIAGGDAAVAIRRRRQRP